jgi:hypothetical protein
LAALPDDFDAVVTLRLKDVVLTASAKAMLANGTPEKWLSGPLVSEWWVKGPFRDKAGKADPHLFVQFGIRSYGKNRPLRVEADVENDWAYVPGPKTEFYDAEIRADGRAIYSQSKMIQPSHTRWRYGFWWKAPVATYVRQDLQYLKKARVVPNYDPALAISDATLNELLDRFETALHGPMTSGIIEKYMPSTGARWDIAPLPHWQVLYLLTMDPRAYTVMLQTADQGASFSSHYRNEKTRLPITLDDFPNFTTHANAVGKGPKELPMPDSGGYRDPLEPDAAHEPALDFLPYLVTGDRFYLEELQFWAEWNLSRTGGIYRNYADGLVKFDQVRGQAWSLRTLAQAAYITPDQSPLKHTLLHELQANIAWYNKTYAENPSANALHILPQNDAPYDGKRAIAPWQDDFFTWAVGYVDGLGDVSAKTLARWKGGFAVGRMTAPGFCWIMAPAYTLRVRDAAQSPFYQSFAQVGSATLNALAKSTQAFEAPSCGSSDMARLVGSHGSDSMAGSENPSGMAAMLRPALAAAVDAGTPGAAGAWQKLVQQREPDFSNYPDWAIVPRSN